MASQMINSLEEFHRTLSIHTYVVFYFLMQQCRHCDVMGPLFERVALANKNGSEHVLFAKVCMDNQQGISGAMNIDKAPTMLLFRKGREVSRLVGEISHEALEKWLKESLTLKTDENTQFSNGSDIACTGIYRERRKRKSLFNANKPFPDLEPNCVIKPTPELNGAQIGYANEGTSYFAISVWKDLDDIPGKVCLGLAFMPDPNENERFESALFQVTFGQDSGEKHVPLNIIELFPTCTEDLNSRVFYDAFTGGVSTTEPEEEDSSLFSESIFGEGPEVPNFTTLISGQGTHSPTATWNLIEDETKEIKRGLDAHYNLWVKLPTTQRVWMKFYAKAVLVSGDKRLLGFRKRVMLQSGSLEEQYERKLDLSVVFEHNKT